MIGGRDMRRACGMSRLAVVVFHDMVKRAVRYTRAKRAGLRIELRASDDDGRPPIPGGTLLTLMGL
jgi:hypothetical protein